MSDERPTLRIVARTDPAALPPKPTDLQEKISRMIEIAFRRARMQARSVEGGKRSDKPACPVSGEGGSGSPKTDLTRP